MFRQLLYIFLILVNITQQSWTSRDHVQMWEAVLYSGRVNCFQNRKKREFFQVSSFFVYIKKLYQFKVPLISDLYCNNLIFIFIFHYSRSKIKFPFTLMTSDEILLVWKLFYFKFSLNLRVKNSFSYYYTAKQAIPFWLNPLKWAHGDESLWFVSV